MTNLQKALDALTRISPSPSEAVNRLLVAVRSVSADALKTLLEQEATIARLTAEVEEARAQAPPRSADSNDPDPTASLTALPHLEDGFQWARLMDGRRWFLMCRSEIAAMNNASIHLGCPVVVTGTPPAGAIVLDPKDRGKWRRFLPEVEVKS